MPTYKKMYTIEITSFYTGDLWYATKVGKRYEAILVSSPHGGGSVLFEVQPLFRVHPLDCRVVGEYKVPLKKTDGREKIRTAF